MHKKILVRIICLIATAILLTAAVLAAGEMQITVDSASAAPGDSVQVPIRLEQNPGVAGLVIVVAFDSDLTLTNVTYNSAIGGTAVEAYINNNHTTLSWYTDGHDAWTEDGVFATMTFEVSDSATEGTKAITLEVEDTGNVCDIALADIPFTLVSGSVTVSEECTHTWDDGVVTTAPTCTEKGVKTYTCTKCGETYTEDVPAIGHTAADAVHENEVPANCVTAGGYDSVVYCSVCHAELSRTHVTIPATGEHTWDEGVVTTEPTETEPGVMTYTCTVCGTTKTEPIPPINDWLHIAVDTVETHPGRTIEVPIRISNNPGVAGIRLEVSYDSDLELVIDELIEADDEYSPYGTSFQGGTELDENDNPVVLAWAKAKNVTKNTTFATLTFRVAENAAPGLKTIALSIQNVHDVVHIVDNNEENLHVDLFNGGVTVTAEHDWDAGTVTLAPECMTTGIRHHICSICGDEKDEVIAALDHDLIHHDAQAQSCTEIGWDAYDTCSRCDYTTYVELPALGHDLIHHEAQAATCTEIGWDAYDTCSRCDYTTYVELPALGHDLHYTADGATITETCSRCDHTATATISAETVKLHNAIDGPVENAMVAYADSWLGGELTVSYENNTAPGIATASITIDGATASVQFAIYMPGDINGDCQVTVADSVRLLRYIAKPETTNVVAPALDVNGDGTYGTVADSVRLLRYIAKPETVEIH